MKLGFNAEDAEGTERSAGKAKAEKTEVLLSVIDRYWVLAIDTSGAGSRSAAGM